MLPALGVWWSSVLFHIWVTRCGFHKYYGCGMVKTSLLVVLIYYNFRAFLLSFHWYNEQNSDTYFYRKWTSYFTHCTHTANVKNSCKSYCSRNLIVLAWRKLHMHLNYICIFLRPSHVFWLKYSSVYTLLVGSSVSPKVVLRLDSQSLDVAPPVSSVMESPKVLTRNVF